MFSSQVISGISGGVLGIVGLLLVMSSMKQRRVDWRIGIGVPLFGLGLFILVTDLPQYALGFSILATLAMAFAALLNIKQSADRENRDREERWLKEIKDWATNILIAGMSPGERGIFEFPRETELFKVNLLKRITEMSRLNREGIAFKYIDLPNWESLVNKTKKLRRAIGVQVGLLDECSKSLNDKAKNNAANEHRGKMNNIAESIIKEAQNIRSNLLRRK